MIVYFLFFVLVVKKEKQREFTVNFGVELVEASRQAALQVHNVEHELLGLLVVCAVAVATATATVNRIQLRLSQDGHLVVERVHEQVQIVVATRALVEHAQLDSIASGGASTTATAAATARHPVGVVVGVGVGVGVALRAQLGGRRLAHPAQVLGRHALGRADRGALAVLPAQADLALDHEAQTRLAAALAVDHFVRIFLLFLLLLNFVVDFIRSFLVVDNVITRLMLLVLSGSASASTALVDTSNRWCSGGGGRVGVVVVLEMIVEQALLAEALLALGKVALNGCARGA